MKKKKHSESGIVVYVIGKYGKIIEKILPINDGKAFINYFGHEMPSEEKFIEWLTVRNAIKQRL